MAGLEGVNRQNHASFSDSVKSRIKKIGAAFNRTVARNNKVTKHFHQQAPNPHPQRPVHMRGAKMVSPQNHVNPTALSSKSNRAQLPQRPKSSGEGAALYENIKYRHLVSRERVTAQFEQPQQVSRNIMNAAWSAHNQGKTPWGQNHALLVKGGQLGQISINISQHSQALKQPLSANKGEIEQQGRQVIDNLQKGINQLSQLLHQQGGMMHPTEYQQLNGLLQSLHNEQKLMLQVMDDPGVSSVAGSLDLTQAMELKRLGYDLTPTMVKHFSSFNDSNLIRGSDQKFGSGAIHSVTKLQFQTTTGVVEKIFKGDDPIDPCPFDSITGAENYLDKSKPRFATRNFAAAKFDNLLGTGLMPNMELTVHDGQVGVLMDVAKGVKPYDQSTNQINWTPVEDDRQPQKAAKIQEQLNSAEWLDGICAQQDRHAGNLFIDPEDGKVTLIDNDMGFYPGLHQVRTPSKPGGFRRFAGSTAGLPSVIDARVYEKLMSITPAQIHQQMDGLITREEAESTVSRVKELQSHASRLASNGRVIENWQQWKDPSTGLNAAQFQRRYAPDSYLLSVQGQTRGL
ncbi:hypothetical protein [Endozoicomonas sp. YOMI1]|uniref:hypothetical protein n=1 Tax=Endozoicomonas sp. YOMI1 TaxID=2828739 RepID=UPI0021488114|nr:hypothetical protein [Endozoicomonas sp. YOMI1]